MKYLIGHRAQHSLKTYTKCSRATLSRSRRYLSSTTQSTDPHKLRILFCGSDEFSIHSLEALHKYAELQESRVQSIEVATRTDKRTGRGLKTITAPPIKDVALRLHLPLHQFDTFRDWSLPTLGGFKTTYINMIIAVSFGLLVPPRILNACQFGGLNVHPSMLPDLKGSAPIEHAIIHGYSHTGVTIQTLHPSKFDEGQVVLQTPQPGLAIPNPNRITSDELKGILAPVGADMLVQTLRDGLYLRDGQDPVSLPTIKHASKISPESRHVDFTKMNSAHILRLNRALSRLWLRVCDADDHEREIRVILGKGLRLAQPQDIGGISTQVLAELKSGLPFAVVRQKENIKHSNTPLYVKMLDSSMLLIPEILVSGMKAGPSAAKAAKAGLFQEPLQYGECNLYQFKKFPD